jgi:hypothetical protein
VWGRAPATRFISSQESILKTPLLAAEGFVIQEILIQGENMFVKSEG